MNGSMSDLDPRLRLGLLAAGLIMDFVRRHHAATGELPTDDQVKAELERDLRDGRSTIHAWFVERGLTPPADGAVSQADGHGE